MANITVDQVKEALQTPELKTAIIGLVEPDVLAAVKAKGISVRTKEEDMALLQNHEKNVIPGLVSAQISDKIKEVWDKVDNDVFEITGLKKEPTEKTYEFNKKVIKELKEKIEKAKKDGDPVLKDELEALKKSLKEKEGYVAPGEVEKLRSDFAKERLSITLNSALERKPIAIPAHITDEKQKQAYVANQRKMLSGDFMSRFTVKQTDGKTVYYEGDKLLTNSSDASPMTEEQIIEQYYSTYFVPEKKSGGGAGSGAGGAASDPTEASLKNKEQLMVYLQEVKKLTVGSPAYLKEYERIRKDQGIPE